MRRARARAAALLGGLVVAGLAGWWALGLRRAGDTPDVDREAVHELLESRQRGEREAPEGARGGPQARELYLPEDVAATLFAVHTTAQVYDPWCYHMHKPGLDVRVPWEEHPAGAWHFRTNSLGLREDEELAEGPFDLRVLVTGDSHTEGFCDNRESFPNLLEAALRRSSDRAVDVLNAGNGAWSFHNYLGLLEKLLDAGLRPDVFVVCVYAGNDFVEVLPPHAWFTRTALPRETPGQAARRKQVGRIDGSLFTQLMSSLMKFSDHPELEETALAAGVELLTRTQALCQDAGIELLVLTLPDPMQADREAHAELFERLERELDLDENARAIHPRLARELRERLATRGVRTVDLAPAFAPGGGPYFWRRDLHLSVRGHAAVAAALETLLAARPELAR